MKDREREHLLDLLCEAVNELDGWFDDGYGKAPMTSNEKVNEARQILLNKGYTLRYLTKEEQYEY